MIVDRGRPLIEVLFPEDAMPPKTERLQVRVEPATKELIERLGRLWGPVVELSVSEVIRECVERVGRQEFGEDAPAPRAKKRPTTG